MLFAILYAGRDWGQEEKGMTEDEMVGWHHRLDGHEFEWTPGVGDGQRGLACCNSLGLKESDTTEWLNWTDGKMFVQNYSPFLMSVSLILNCTCSLSILDGRFSSDSFFKCFLLVCDLSFVILTASSSE